MTKIPTSVQIGPFVYRVAHKRLRKQGLAGQIRYARGEIRIDPRLAPSRERETLLHEALHGVIQAAGHKYALVEHSDDCEELLRAISPLLLDTLRRNPALVSYLTSNDPPRKTGAA